MKRWSWGCMTKKFLVIPYVLSSHSSRRLWWYYVSQRIVFVCHLSRIILQDFCVHFVLWWIVQVLKDFVLHYQVCSKFVVFANLKLSFEFCILKPIVSFFVSPKSWIFLCSLFLSSFVICHAFFSIMCFTFSSVF